MWREAIIGRHIFPPAIMLVGGLLFSLLYYSTDLSSNFKDGFIELQSNLKEVADSYLEDGLVPENPSVGRGLHEPLIIFEDKGEKHRIGSVFRSAIEGSQTDGKFLLIEDGADWLAFYSAKNNEVQDRRVQILIPLMVEDKTRQMALFSQHFPGISPVAYSLNTEGVFIVPETGDKVRSSVLRKLGGFFFIGYFLLMFLSMVYYEKGRFAQRLKRPYGIIPTLVILVASRLVLELGGIQHMTSAFPLFDRSTMGWAIGWNLGHLLIDFGILLSIALYFMHLPPLIKKEDFNPGWKAIVSVGGYFTIIAGWALFSSIVSLLILNSTVSIDLEEVFQLDRFSFLTLSGILIYLLAQFLISLKLGETIQGLHVPLGNRVLSIAAAALLSLPLFLALNQSVPPFPFYLTIFLFLFLLDLFTERPNTGGYYWALMWMLVLSGCTAALLYKFTLDNDLEKRKQLATELQNAAENVDELENRLYLISDSISRNNYDRYDFSIYINSQKVWTNSSYYHYHKDLSQSPAAVRTLERKGSRTEYLHPTGKEDLQIVVGKYSSDLFKPVSLFSYIFFLMAIIIFALLLINERLHFLPRHWSVKITGKPSLRRKIQALIISLTLISFVLVGLITIYFFYINSEREKAAVFGEQLQYLETALSSNSGNLKEQTQELSADRKLRLSVYNASGELISEGPRKSEYSGMPVYLPNEWRTEAEIGWYRTQNFNAHYPDRPFQVSVLQTDIGPKYIAFGPDPVYRQQTTAFTDFLGSLLNVYFFLFILSGTLAFAFSDGMTQPLVRIRESLNKVRLGKENEPIEWEHDDELGELIRDYNRIIKEIDDSAKLLAITEREVAWREMAKQVAHEIKNPLTPMKLSIQHLQFASKRGGDNLESLIERTSNTLIEQIDNLSRIASEFSTFAKMPEARNEKINLNELISRAHDLFRNRDDMDISLTVPIDEIYVYADKNYLIRVLTNLVKNSIQAIPIERRGEIKIKLYRKAEFAYMKVTDNGTGIPDEMKEKVFKPNFTSKNSGTGLGLAICHNIVESFHGRIYFETELDKGTSFFVELPLMRMEENIQTLKRVEL